MILKNANIYSDGLIRKGALLIEKGVIKSIILNSSIEKLTKLIELNEVIDCKNKLIIPGIIDIHSHLRDMEQSEKETFLTGTKAAAFSGITTVFNMPNTKPPAINVDQVKKWMKKAENSIFVDVGFIAGVPKGMNFEEIIKIVDLGVLGFKIYPLSPLNEIDWTDSLNVQKLLNISNKFQIPIFIHPDWPLTDKKIDDLYEEYSRNMREDYSFLQFHNNLFPVQMEAKYVNFVLENYYKVITDNNLDPKDYPIVHFCHISCKDSYSILQKALSMNDKLKITFEITPHHLLLSNKIILRNQNFGKVLPPLRDNEHSSYLFSELREGRITLIGTDHAPHTLKEKSEDENATSGFPGFETHTLKEKSEEQNAPSGFPGFETYPILLLDKVCNYELPLENFVKASSENPAKIFNFFAKGFIKEGYDADLVIVDKVSHYTIDSQKFKTKAKFTPFENFKTQIQIWKVFLRGFEINLEGLKPTGKIIKRSL